MALAVSVRRLWKVSARHERVELGWRDNLLTIALGFWLMVGLFIDGWAHNNLDSTLETFFTPWHAVFYSGYSANVLWLCFVILGQYRQGRRGLAAIPRGYHLALLGVLIFGLGGVGDMLWHVILGIEVGLEALLSPTHLLLFLGGMLILAAPFLAGWQSDDATADAPSFARFLPVLGAITLMTSFVSFMHMYLWAPTEYWHSNARAEWITSRYWSARDVMMGMGLELGLQNILITNAILLAPVLLLLRRWRTPWGTVTFLFTLNAVLMAGLQQFALPDSIIIAAITGAVADTLIRVLRPWSSPAAYRTVAMLVPLCFWTLYFSASIFHSGIAWSAEFVGGAVAMASLTGLALSLLMAPPALPERLQAR
jgi:hypothetical protein